MILIQHILIYDSHSFLITKRIKKKLKDCHFMSFYGVRKCHVTQHIGERKQKYNRKYENRRNKHSHDYEIKQNFEICHN